MPSRDGPSAAGDRRVRTIARPAAGPLADEAEMGRGAFCVRNGRAGSRRAPGACGTRTAEFQPVGRHRTSREFADQAGAVPGGPGKSGRNGRWQRGCPRRARGSAGARERIEKARGRH